MELSVIGCGYLGAVHAVAMASLGHNVVGIDTDEARIAALAAGEPPFHEPEFPGLLAAAVQDGSATFTTDPAAAARAHVHFVCVGTPQEEGSDRAYLGYVDAAVDALIPVLREAGHEADVVVGKSTVPVGTAEALAHRLAEAGVSATLIWNPEFLRESMAVHDTLSPDRIVYGIPGSEAGKLAAKTLDEVYYDQVTTQGIPRIVTDLATAQLVKASANAFLATKISFINAVAAMCDAAGADVAAVAEAIGFDERIGKKFLRAGVGYGGGCLPKDIRAFVTRADELGVGPEFEMFRAVDALNSSRRQRVVDIADEMVGGLPGKRVAVLGAAFKPDSDDVRDSPAIAIAELIEEAGATVCVTDPQAIPVMVRRGTALAHEATAASAAAGADLVVLATEWREYIDIDPVELGSSVSHRAMLDARNALDPERWKAAGWTYRGMGRR